MVPLVRDAAQQLRHILFPPCEEDRVGSSLIPEGETGLGKTGLSRNHTARWQQSWGQSQAPPPSPGAGLTARGLRLVGAV